MAAKASERLVFSIENAIITHISILSIKAGKSKRSRKLRRRRKTLMRILQANKFYYPKGGADKYFLDLTAALKAAGQETAVFAMADSHNLKSPDEKYFVSEVKLRGGNLKDQFKIPGRIYNREAKRKFARELADFKPDIIHVHNIYHQISPSILDAAKEKNIPVVMHLHDYNLICPNYLLYSQGHYCQKCLDQKNYWPCLYNNCYDSWIKSFGAALETTIHHQWLHIYEKNIDLLIAPSEFMRRKVIDSGWPKEKIVTLYNPAPKISAEFLKDKDNYLETLLNLEKDYLLYFGRLAPEKGINDLIAAVKNSGRKLHIAGDGAEEKNIRRNFVSEIKQGQIKLLGRLTGDTLKNEIVKARAIVFPSLWPENMPLALLESLAQGKIVIASRVGGLPEIIKNKINGFLFAAGDIEGLKTVIKTVYRLNSENRKQIKQEALKTAKGLDPDEHLDKILKIYSKLAKKSG